MGGFGTTTRNLETGEYWISEGVYKIFGLQRLSALSTRSVVELWAETVHPDDVEAVRAEVAAGIEDGSEHDIVHRIIRPDGEERLVHSKGKRIDATGGHPAIFLATVVDVTPPA
jgi:PAS domain S-box-containing protein